MSRPILIFHIAINDDWRERSDTYVPSAFDGEGFIHCSTADQLKPVANGFYAGRDDLVLLTIDMSKVSGIVVFEDIYNAGEEFPHIYGPLPLTAIVKAEPFSVS